MNSRSDLPTRKRKIMISCCTTSIVSILVLTPTLISADFIIGGNNNPNNGWNLPPLTKQHRKKEHFLNECDQTLATIFNLLQQTRGGASDDNYRDGSGYNNYPRNNNNKSPQQQYSSSNDDFYTSDRRDYNDATGDPYDDYYDDYDYKGNRPSSSSSPASSLFPESLTSLSSSIPNVIKNGDRKIGLGLLGSGVIVTLLGISLFFNRTLMRLGNLLFIAGVPLTIGPSRTFGYFVQPEKVRATSCLLLGIFLVFVGHPTFGIALEIFGILNLFGNMFPMLLFFAKQMPGLSTILNNSDKTFSNANTKKEPRKPATDDDYYYDDYYDPDYDQRQQQRSQEQYYNDDPYGRDYYNNRN